jgi:hypothetical protein
MHWLKRSLACTRDEGDLGVAFKMWNSRPRNGWTGSTIGGFVRRIGDIPPAELEETYYRNQKPHAMVAGLK